MIVGTCGFGSTGSSAVTDYLKEFNNFQVVDDVEFTWISAVDGLIDLDMHVNHPHGRTGDSIAAISRYLKLCEKKCYTLEQIGVPRELFLDSVKNFIESIETTSWMWYNPVAEHDTLVFRLVQSFLRRTGILIKWEMKNGRQWEGYPFEKVTLSVKPENFVQKAKKHVMEVFEAMGADFSRPIALDQPFPGNDPQSCFKYFDDPYAIVVDRDPRDNYVFAKTKLLSKSFSHLMPVNRVEDFVKYYRALRDKQPYKDDDERVLSIKFEDMVYHYEDTTKQIRNFLHLPENPNPKSIFDPAISMPNTQVWKRYPQFAKDIEFIEQELPDYLFDYSGCPEPDPNGRMFVGRSPKNK